MTREWRDQITDQIESIKSSWTELEDNGSTFLALERLLELKSMEKDVQQCSDCNTIKLHFPSPKRLFAEIAGFYFPLIRFCAQCNECVAYNNKIQGDAISLIISATDAHGPILSLTHCLDTIRYLTGKVFCPDCRLSDDERQRKWIVFLGLKRTCVQIVQTLICWYFLSRLF